MSRTRSGDNFCPAALLLCRKKLFYLYELNLEVQLFACHFMVGIEGDGGFGLVGNGYREMLAVLVLQINALATVSSSEPGRSAISTSKMASGFA